MTHALFRFIHPASQGGALPHRQDALPVLRMEAPHPSLFLDLFDAQIGIFVPTLITRGKRAVRSLDPDQLGKGIDEGMEFHFSALACGNVDASEDEVVDVALSPTEILFYICKKINAGK